MEDYRMKIATMRVDDEEHQLFQGEDVKILDQKMSKVPPYFMCDQMFVPESHAGYRKLM